MGDVMAEKTVKEIVDLWYETQMGNIYKCRKKQLEFSDVMYQLEFPDKSQFSTSSIDSNP